MRNPDLVDEKTARAVLGGNRPISKATLWRGTKSGKYPAPIKVGPKSNRWIRAELAAYIEKMAARRDAVFDPVE